MPTANVTDLKTLNFNGAYVYRLGATDLNPWMVGEQVTITGGSGWTPGTYTIIGAGRTFDTGSEKPFWQLDAVVAPTGTGGGQATIPDSDLALTAPCGYAVASVSGSDVLLNVIGPTVTGGGTLTREWKYSLLTAPFTQTLILGQTGVNLTNWVVPPALRDKPFALYANIKGAAGYGKILGVGTNANFYFYYPGENEGLYGLAFAPFLPPAPTDAQLAALLGVANLPTGKNVTLLYAGDSFTELYFAPWSKTLLLNAPLATAYGTRIKIIGLGHSGSKPSDWSPNAPASGLGQGKKEGVLLSGKNNYQGLIDEITAAKAAGDIVGVSIELGTNNDGSTAGGEGAAYIDLVNGARTAGADFFDSHDTYTVLDRDVTLQKALTTDWPTFLNTVAAQHPDYHKRGVRQGYSDYLQYPDDIGDKKHATTDAGKERLTRRYLGKNLEAMASIYASTGPTPEVQKLILSINSGTFGQASRNITPNNITDLPEGTAAVYCNGNGGNIVCMCGDNENTITYFTVTSKSYLPIITRRVLASATIDGTERTTTATDLRAIY